MKSIHKIQSYPILLWVLALLLGPTLGQAQIDEQRMERDVRIMQQALNEMLRQEYNWEFSNRWGSGKEKASYIPDVGIMLVAGNSGAFFPVAPRVYEEDEEREGTEIEEVFKDFLADYGDLARELPEDEVILLRYTSKDSDDSFHLAQSADGPVEKKSKWASKGNFEKITAKISKENVLKFRRGEINREEFDNRIEFTRSETDSENSKEFKIFGQILKSLFESDNSASDVLIATYFDTEEEEECEPCYDDALKWNTYSFKTAWGDRVDFERIEGLGAIYDVSLGYYLEGYNSILSLRSNRGRLRVNGEGWVVEEGEEPEEEEINEERRDYLLMRDDKLEDIYGDFIREMKEAMVLYGRTLRSLPDDEFLIIRAELPACYECELPANVEFKVQRAVLDEFDEKEVDFDEIEEKIQVTEEGEARKLQNLERLLYDSDSKIQVYSNGRGRDIRIIRERDAKKKNNN